MTSPTLRRVAVIGAGLVGTSVALALRNAGIHVTLSDRDANAVSKAVAMGAGVAATTTDPRADVVVIATPPSTVAGVLCDAQARRLGMVYTDVASAKVRVVAEVERAGADLGTFVPGHPIAGGVRVDPAIARPDLFSGRPWALCPSRATNLVGVLEVVELVTACGAAPRTLTPEEHDRILAVVSHVPHVVSAILAARFADAGPGTLSWAGAGLEDATRTATADPDMWSDILRHNAEHVVEELETVMLGLISVVRSLRVRAGADNGGALVGLLTQGNLGRGNIVRAQK